VAKEHNHLCIFTMDHPNAWIWYRLI